MTRINVVPVEELCNKHLLAEWREMPRLAGYLKRSLNRKGKPFNKDEIPRSYLLGQGHVKFFYDKFLFLYKRHRQLTDELISRGFELKYNSDKLRSVPKEYYNDWKPTKEDRFVNRMRIARRMPKIAVWG
jgi:deoxyribonuclease (pyrimidine dimer)